MKKMEAISSSMSGIQEIIVIENQSLITSLAPARQIRVNPPLSNSRCTRQDTMH